jgi:hypothetical protein
LLFGLSGHSSVNKRLFWKFLISFDSQKFQVSNDIYIISELCFTIEIEI